MNVLLTGGAGFIGSHTADALLAMGARVKVLDNFSNGKRENLRSHPLLSICEGDIRDPDTVRSAMQGVTHVLHLAAQVSVQASVADPVNSCETNIQGFVNVLDTARQAGVSRFVYASSAAVYGIPEHLPLSEVSPVIALSPYGLEKAVKDQYANLYQKLYGFPGLGLRYFNVYGPRQDPRSPYAGVISKFLDRIQARAPLQVFGDGSQTRDFIFVKDVAHLNVKALQSSDSGICNIATGNTVSLLQLAEALSRLAGYEIPIDFLPAQKGDIPHSATRIDRLRQWLGIERFTGLDDGLTELLASNKLLQQAQYR